MSAQNDWTSEDGVREFNLAMRKRRAALKAAQKRSRAHFRAKYAARKAARKNPRKNPRRNPASKALIAAAVGAGLAGLAWHMYVQKTTGQGANVRDPYFLGVAGAGGVVGYLVGGKI